MKNKKGFTLVELLAVIVILALIMSIAIVSIGGVLNSSRRSTFKETAVSIINGVRQHLTIANRLEEGYYQFTSSLLEKGGADSPLGGTIQYLANLDDCSDKIGDHICKLSQAQSCSASDTLKSFVHVAKSGDVFTYEICLNAGAGHSYINMGSETALLNNNDNSMIVDPTSSTPTPTP